MLQVATSFQNVKLTLMLMEQLFTKTLCMLRTLALIRFTDTRYLKQYNGHGLIVTFIMGTIW